MQSANIRQIKAALVERGCPCHWDRRCGQTPRGPAFGYDTRLVGWTLVFGGQRVHCVRRLHASFVKEHG
jgi:hypothetical protein